MQIVISCQNWYEFIHLFLFNFYIVYIQTKDAADACIAAGREGEISIHGSVVETMPAQNREDLQKGNNKKDVKRDSRHLYLVKEGSESQH